MNKNFFFISFFSIIYSLIEIELEAQEGWMKEIPTANVIKMGNKHMTLYHIYMLLIITSIFIYKVDINNFNDILLIFSYILLVLFLEDTLWFVFNPYFTIKRYKKEEIWWHSEQIWIWRIPMMNIILYSLLFICYYITQNQDILNNSINSLLLLGICIIISPLYHLFYKKIHKIEI